MQDVITAANGVLDKPGCHDWAEEVQELENKQLSSQNKLNDTYSNLDFRNELLLVILERRFLLGRKPI